MTVAELHGKIGSEGSNLSSRLEDLLTADIFGPIRYLPYAGIAAGLLSPARQGPEGTGPALRDHPVVAAVLKEGLPEGAETFQFWPRPGQDQTEPDVLITWSLPSGQRFHVMVEVKYLSGKSGEGVDPAEGGRLRDQLGREYQLLEGLGDGVLVYLTADKTVPTESIRLSLESAGAPTDAPLYWLGWSQVYWEIRRLQQFAERPHEALLWRDMRELLERKGLAGLRPWGELGVQPVTLLDHPYHRVSRYAWPKTTIGPITPYVRFREGDNGRV